MELKVKELRRFTAQHHTLKEDLKVVHDSTDLGVNGQGEGNGSGHGVQQHLGPLHSVVDPVVDVEVNDIVVAHPAAAHIGLVRQDQGGSHRVYGKSGGRWRG